MAQRDIVFWGTACAVIVLDRLTKYLIAQHIAIGQSIDFSFFSFVHILNTGTAFGLLKNGSLFFTFFSLAVILYLVIKYRTYPSSLAPILGLILGGAAGNLLDRLLYGAVLDFIDFRFWPAFNVADSAITIAIVLLLFFELKEGSKKKGRRG